MGPEVLSVLDKLVRSDAWTNFATQMGVEGKDHRRAATFRPMRRVDRVEYDAMYIEDPLFGRMVDMLPDAGTRKWIELSAQDESGKQGEVENDFGAVMLDALEELDAQDKMYELWRLARLDGGSALVLGANDGRDPSEPLEIKNIRSLDFLHVVSRWEINPGPIDRDMASPTYREPLWWTPTTGDSSGGKIHHSRVVRMRGMRVSDSIDRQSMIHPNDPTTTWSDDQYWGMPLVQRVYDDLRQFNAVFSYVEAAFKDLQQGVFGMKNLAELRGDPDADMKLMKRMQLINLAASVFNMVLIDPEFESYERRTMALSGIDAVMIRFMEKLSAASEIPLVKLFGMAPAGLSTDDQSGEKAWRATVATQQRRKLLTPIRRLIDVVGWAKDGPTGGQMPDKYKATFNELDEPDELAESQRRKHDAETDVILVNGGVLERHEARSRLRTEGGGQYVLDPKVDEALEAVSEVMLDPDTMIEQQRQLQALREQGPPGGAGDDPGADEDEDLDDDDQE